MANQEQIKYQNKYIAEKYDRFTMTFPAGKKEVYRAYAESKGYSLNGYINHLIQQDMQQQQDTQQLQQDTQLQKKQQEESKPAEG